MKRKCVPSRPWTVTFSWNVPTEVFDCLKCIAVDKYGGTVITDTKHTFEIHLLDEDHTLGFFLGLGNTYCKNFKVDEICLKYEKDGSYSKIVVGQNKPFVFKYSKKREIIRLTTRYGHYNRVGVPQYTH